MQCIQLKMHKNEISTFGSISLHRNVSVKGYGTRCSAIFGILQLVSSFVELCLSSFCSLIMAFGLSSNSLIWLPISFDLILPKFRFQGSATFPFPGLKLQQRKITNLSAEFFYLCFRREYDNVKQGFSNRLKLHFNLFCSFISKLRLQI